MLDVLKNYERKDSKEMLDSELDDLLKNDFLIRSKYEVVNGKINVRGNVTWTPRSEDLKKLQRLPVDFGVVKGNFRCCYKNTHL